MIEQTANVHVMTVKPGFVDTKMTKHLHLPKFLTASPKKVSMDIVYNIKAPEGDFGEYKF